MPMKLSGLEIVHRLGRGESIASVCSAAQISREEFDAWWKAELERRLPVTSGPGPANSAGPVEIVRDTWGIPHLLADTDEALFYGFGYAMAQDRLFQLDYLRRRALGRLSEVLGAESLDLDLVARTVNLGATAEAEWAAMGAEARQLMNAFSAGVNAYIAASADAPPVEFDLLDYKPEPWRPVDSLAIAGELRWYLTGRLPIIAVPELVRRKFGDGPQYQAFIRAEADEESIVPHGLYPSVQRGLESLSGTGGAAEPAPGSNNWVVAGPRTVTGKPLLASDPHIALGAVSCWYEVHLCGGSFNVAGMAYVGMPGVMFGRNEYVAWGCTNNACSQRNLYQEKTDAAHPDCFLFDGQWEPAQTREEVIRVRDAEPVRKTIRSSRHGPIIDELLPPALRSSEPVSLRWLGSDPCGWQEALLGMDRATSAEALREAMRPWIVPTFCLVFCDVDGHIGYQAVGRIPVRKFATRSYLEGWNPDHVWEGLIPFEGMPRLADPPRGFAITANNRPAPDDFPYPLAGVWPAGYRARRIREMIEGRDKLALDNIGAMQLDVLYQRAVDCVPSLLKLLAGAKEPALQQAVEDLRNWDGRMEPDSRAALIFELFFTHWCHAVAQEHFSGEAATLVSAAAPSLAVPLLHGDAINWFGPGKREAAVRSTLAAALDAIGTRLGPDRSQWTWGALHRSQQRHVLTARGDLASLLDQPSFPIRGNPYTVCNTGGDAEWQANLAGGYRMIVDMSVQPPEMWAVDAGSESGHPGSPHYCDQMGDWIAGRYHRLSLDRAAVDAAARHRLRLEPTG
jgi:penicillin amidase